MFTFLFFNIKYSRLVSSGVLSYIIYIIGLTSEIVLSSISLSSSDDTRTTQNLIRYKIKPALNEYLISVYYTHNLIIYNLYTHNPSILNISYTAAIPSNNATSFLSSNPVNDTIPNNNYYNKLLLFFSSDYNEPIISAESINYKKNLST